MVLQFTLAIDKGLIFRVLRFAVLFSFSPQDPFNQRSTVTIIDDRVKVKLVE